jgi:hypothetical protein
MGGATIVAIAALFLTATSVQAAVVNLTVVPGLSSLKIGGNIDASSVGGPGFKNLPISAQGPGGDITSYSGSISIDLQPGTIQLLTGSSIVAANSGVWSPAGTNGGGDPVAGTFAPANYGVQVAAIGALSTYYNLVMDFGAPIVGIASTPTPLVGNNFNLLGQAMSYDTGRTAITSGLGNGDSNYAGFPTIFGTNGVDTGTWDGTTLTIPVHSTVTYTIDEDLGIIGTVTMTGTLVATTIPEPSTMIMAGLGVVGLVAAGYRARKRNA